MFQRNQFFLELKVGGGMKVKVEVWEIVLCDHCKISSDESPIQTGFSVFQQNPAL